MITKRLSKEILKNLQSLVQLPVGDSLRTVVLGHGLDKMLLYSTDDVYLNKKQFEALMSLTNRLNEDGFYAANYYAFSDIESYKILDDSNILYDLSQTTSFDEYADLFLAECSLLISKSYRWVIIIEETLEGGVSIMAANKTVLDLFRRFYSNYPAETEN